MWKERGRKSPSPVGTLPHGRESFPHRMAFPWLLALDFFLDSSLLILIFCCMLSQKRTQELDLGEEKDSGGCSLPCGRISRVQVPLLTHALARTCEQGCSHARHVIAVGPLCILVFSWAFKGQIPLRPPLGSQVGPFNWILDRSLEVKSKIPWILSSPSLGWVFWAFLGGFWA